MRTTTILYLLVLSLTGCSGGGQPPSVDRVDQSNGGKIEVPGLHNLYRITDKLYSGSSPEGDEGFRSLQQLRVRTIISVDGAKPDIDRARKYDLRYVHIPIGYDSVPEEQAHRLAKAVRDLPGPVYLHCHHGKHRGPAAAAVVHRCLDDNCSVEAALAEMRRAGTDPRYTGLYAAPARFRALSRKDLDDIPSEFPEIAPVTALASLMVAVDTHWEHLKQTRAAGWKAPDTHPDLDPPHEALLLVEHYREAMRLREAQDRPAEFRRLLMDAEQSAKELEQALRSPQKSGAEQAFRKIGKACTQCHEKYRDVLQKPQLEDDREK